MVELETATSSKIITLPSIITKNLLKDGFEAFPESKDINSQFKTSYTNLWFDKISDSQVQTRVFWIFYLMADLN